MEGDVEWKAPEVKRENKGSKAGDYWMLGCFIYYLMSGGFLPFEGEFADEVAADVQFRGFGFDDQTDSLLGKLLHPDPKQRLIDI